MMKNFETKPIDESLYKWLIKGDTNTLDKGYSNQVISYKKRYFNVSKEKIEEGILCIGRDITEEINANKRAETDVLTGLFNRRKFICDMDRILKYNGDGFYLALIDIDNLKNLNNNYGHLKGDKYLEKLGQILNNTNKGKFYRIGGDEFAGIVRLNKKDVKSMFDNIFKEFKEFK